MAHKVHINTVNGSVVSSTEGTCKYLHITHVFLTETVSSRIPYTNNTPLTRNHLEEPWKKQFSECTLLIKHRYQTEPFLVFGMVPSRGLVFYF